jgi:hypothetical protein
VLMKCGAWKGIVEFVQPEKTEVVDLVGRQPERDLTVMLELQLGHSCWITFP